MRRRLLCSRRQRLRNEHTKSGELLMLRARRVAIDMLPRCAAAAICALPPLFDAAFAR